MTDNATWNLVRNLPGVMESMENIDKYNDHVLFYSGFQFWLLVGCGIILIAMAVYFYLKKRRAKQ